MPSFDFTKTTSAVSEPVYQYDYGCVISATGTGLEDGSAPEVHFALREEGPSIARVATVADGVLTVTIPNELLIAAHRRGDYSIYAYIYVTTTDTGKTCYKGRVPVLSRPETGEPEAEDVYPEALYTAVSALIQEGVDDAEAQADRAGTYADEASAYATASSRSADDAAAHAQVAQEAEEEAEEISAGLEGRIQTAVAEQVPGAVAEYLEEHPVTYDDTEIRELTAQAQETADEALSVGNQAAAGVVDLTGRMAAAEGDITTLQGAVVSAQADATAAGTAAASAQTTASTAQSGVTALGTRVTTLEGAGYQTATQVQAAIDASVGAALSTSY